MKRLALVLFSTFCLTAAVHAADGVTDAMLVDAQENENAWLHYNRSYEGWRFMPSDLINRENIKRLVPKWVYQTGIVDGAFECTAIFYDDKLYITTPNSHLRCVDAKTGKPIWSYDHPLPQVNLCCGPVNRGVAIKGNRVYFCTLDSHLLCFDRETGLMLWDRTVADYREANSLTMAPLIIGDNVLVGIGGAEFGARGFIDAYNWETGEQAWRFWTVPGPGEPGHETWEGDSWKQGGATAWLTGTYDPELDLTFWGVGNPSPDFYGKDREGDNLYSETIIALRPKTGELVWHFQTVPHDVFDWSGVQEPMVIDEEIDGEPRKLIVQANRNGYLYALDRTNGEFIRADPFSKVTWANIDETGKPIRKPELLEMDRREVCPGIFGGSNWPASAYSPDTHMIYIPDQIRCTTYLPIPATYRPGLPYYGGVPMFHDDENATGFIRAHDVRTGEKKWEFEVFAPNWAGLLATGGGLVFGGSPDGTFRAFNDETGEVLWEFQTGSGIYAPPVSFVMDGKQYIGLASGWGQPNEAVGISGTGPGCAYYLFGLLED